MSNSPHPKFKTIVADPPWAYKTRMSGTLIPGATDTPAMKTAPMPYPTMNVDKIAALPVRDFSEDDSHLYLWTTQSFLRDAYSVLDAWGFRQGAILVWSKPPKGVCGTYVCSVEFCIFGRRGNLQHKRRQLGTCYQWPRSSHSTKPEAFLDMEDKMTFWESVILGSGFTIGTAAALIVLVFVLAFTFGLRTFGIAFMESYRKSFREAADKKRAEKENRGVEVKPWPTSKGH